MNRTWQIRRETVAHPDGQRRWDRAYQLLLCWAADTVAAPAPTIAQEEADAHHQLGCMALEQKRFQAARNHFAAASSLTSTARSAPIASALRSESAAFAGPSETLYCTR